MTFHWNNLWLFHGLVLIICSIKLLNVSALTCDVNGNSTCQCATASDDGTFVFINEKFRCDGDLDCTDGSDELNCAKRECLATEHKCGNGRCLTQEWICDNYADCLDGSDEKQLLCNFTTCASDHFRCYNGICFPGSFKCDRQKDCLGGEDEQDCVYPANCSADYFQCNNAKCIDKSFQCDGEDDCGDNTDETDCSTTCSPNSFTCKSGKCIPQNLKCNGKNDCLDGSDEDSCPTVSPPTCSKDEFLCDGECEPDFLKCDGEPDCKDGIDELGCAVITCSSREDLCDDGKSCIMKYKFCDGRVNCRDGSDEKASRCATATTTVAPTIQFTCGTKEYKCKDALKCINNTKICDKHPDCPGGDDEVSCSINECEKDNGNCSHICHDTETSYYCSCKHGFKMLNDSKTCKDINECETIGKCSQVCTNTEGSYKCSCTSGYVLSPNGRNCIPSSGNKEKLLIAVGLDVRSVEHDGSQMKCVVNKNTKNAVAVAVHHKKNIIFWADAYIGKIFSSILDRKDIPAKVVATGSSLKDLAIDWITEKLYWLTTSSQVSTIHVAEFNGSNQKTVNTVQEDIHSIAVDPLGGYLYWTSSIARKISRAYMNGEHKEDIITTSLKSPTGLTIDYPNNKLFWLDSKMHYIESSDLDGKNRRRIVEYDLPHPFDIAVFGDYIYWSDSILKTVSSANKFTGKNKTVLINGENITSFVPKGISIHHFLSQPAPDDNPCTNNGGCSHLCLLVPNGFQCACPETSVLLSDQKNCKMPAKPTTTPMPQDATSTTPSTTTGTKTGAMPKTQQTTAGDAAHSKSERSGMNPQILGGIIAGVVFILLILIIVIVWYRRKNNTSKMEIHYNSEVGKVKILSEDGRNPTQSKKDVDRDAYSKFPNKEFDIDEEDDEDLDPVFKTFRRQEDEEGLINDLV